MTSRNLDYKHSHQRRDPPSRRDSGLRHDNAFASPSLGHDGQNIGGSTYYDRETLRNMRQRYANELEDTSRSGQKRGWAYVSTWLSDAASLKKFSTEDTMKFLDFVTKARKQFLQELEVNLKDEINRATLKGDRITSKLYADKLEEARTEYSRIVQFGIYKTYKLTIGIPLPDTKGVYEGDRTYDSRRAGEHRTHDYDHGETPRGVSRGNYDGWSGGDIRQPETSESRLRYEIPSRNIKEPKQRTPVVDDDDELVAEFKLNLEMQDTFVQDMKDTTYYIEDNIIYQDCSTTMEFWRKDRRLLQNLRISSRSFKSEVETVRCRFLYSLEKILEDEINYILSTRKGGRILDDFKTRLERVEKEKEAITDKGLTEAFRVIHRHEKPSSRANTSEDRYGEQEKKQAYTTPRHYEKQGASPDAPTKKASGTRDDRAQDRPKERLNTSNSTRNASQRAQFRSPTSDQHRSKINSNYAKSEVNTSRSASLDPKTLKDECVKYTKDCDNIAKDSLVCWEREVMKTGIEQIKKLNEIDPNSQDFYKKLTPIMSEFIDWFTENGNNELKSIERRAKKNNVINETHKEVKKSLNDLLKQGTRLQSKLQSMSR